MERPLLPVDDEPGLVRAAQAGEREAFDELVERYERRVLSAAYRVLGNLHDALEVCQDAFTRAYERITTLDDVHRFGGWMLRIVTNLALNRRRARKPRAEAVLGLVAETAGALHDEQPGRTLIVREELERVQSAMQELPERQRAALVLYCVEQLPQARVAEILGCSVEAVKWHVFTARRKLRAELGGDV